MKTAPNRHARGSAEATFAADLEELAGLFGVEMSFVDTRGRRQVAATEAVLAVLGALGAEVDASSGGVPDVSQALRAEQIRRHRQLLEPVSVSSAGSRPVVALSLPRGLHPSECWLTLEREDGSVHRIRLLPLISHPLGVVTVDGERIDRYEATLGIRSPDELPPGYHQIRLEGPGIAAESLLVVRPRCPEPARGWGAFLPLHALRNGHDWGVGTFNDLAELGRWVNGLGGSFLGTLPLYPALLDGRVQELSPYLPASKLGWNELFVDPLTLPELADCPEVTELLESTRVTTELATHRGAETVDYPGVMALVRQVLEPLSQSLFARPSSRRSELESFARQNPQLVAYARFRAGSTNRNGLTDSLQDIASLQDDASRYHLYVQWVAEEQLAAASGRLYLDLPIGVHPQGFDPWWEPRSFVTGVEGGAPPDLFFEGGQRWGFQPLDPRGIRERHYRYPIACLRHVMRHAHTVRIDHVMGLQRLYFIPAGFGAGEGVYVRYHHQEMRAIVAVEAHRSNTAVVGEDLGTVPESVREAMGQDRMLRSWVLQFAASPEDPLPEPPEWALASLGTHDLPRFATFWEGGDIDERASAVECSAAWAAEELGHRSDWRRAVARIVEARMPDALRPDDAQPVVHRTTPSTTGGDDLDTANALQVCLEHLAAGPSKLMLVDLEELAGERRPENRPGTGPEAGNWQNRALFTLAELQGDEQALASLRTVDQLRRTGHSPQGTEKLRQIEEVHR